ncbi:MAG TPA: hypothetical protein VGN80_05695 [Devosiaceae bacterium]|jgi:hypothetical protein|nr:hypothetical protein [Devosiaceae bacterium]
MNSNNNWKRLSNLVMGLAIALALIMAVGYVIQATDQRDIPAPDASLTAS